LRQKPQLAGVFAFLRLMKTSVEASSALSDSVSFALNSIISQKRMILIA
jgi:hypothetical protein